MAMIAYCCNKNPNNVVIQNFHKVSFLDVHSILETTHCSSADSLLAAKRKDHFLWPIRVILSGCQENFLSDRLEDSLLIAYKDFLMFVCDGSQISV